MKVHDVAAMVGRWLRIRGQVHEIFIEFANTLVNAGVNQNLVQREKWEDRYAASTMTFVSGIGLIVVFGMLGIGAPIAYYSYSELAAWVVASLAPITLVTS